MLKERLLRGESSWVGCGVSNALIEIAETIFGMLFITVAAPVAAAFFGAC
jgi:hypothetical protein